MLIEKLTTYRSLRFEPYLPQALENPIEYGGLIATSNTEGVSSVLKTGHLKAGARPPNTRAFIDKYLSVWRRSFGIVTGFSLVADNSFNRELLSRRPAIEGDSNEFVIVAQKRS